MKRTFVFAICLSILYAGAAWAFAGCENLLAVAAGHDHHHSGGAHHHDGAAAPQHADSDSQKIHCPNLSSEFFVAPTVSMESERRVAAAVDYHPFDLPSVSQRSSSLRFDLGPPGPTISRLRSIHLLLSVIRI
jgi:hypothetical protein